jgi:hypothetical protein
MALADAAPFASRLLPLNIPRPCPARGVLVGRQLDASPLEARPPLGFEGVGTQGCAHKSPLLGALDEAHLDLQWPCGTSITGPRGGRRWVVWQTFMGMRRRLEGCAAGTRRALRVVMSKSIMQMFVSACLFAGTASLYGCAVESDTVEGATEEIVGDDGAEAESADLAKNGQVTAAGLGVCGFNAWDVAYNSNVNCTEACAQTRKILSSSGCQQVACWCPLPTIAGRDPKKVCNKFPSKCKGKQR